MINFRMRNFAAALLLAFSLPAFAYLEIEICGHATYICNLPDGNSPGTGSTADSIKATDSGTGDAVEVATTPASAANIPQPTAPATATQTPASGQYRSVIGPLGLPEGGADNATLACEAVGGVYQFNGSCGLTAAQCTAVGYTSGCYDGVTVPIGSSYFSVPASCPAGYQVNGANCDLVDSEAVTSDSKVVLVPVNGEFAGRSAGDFDAGTLSVKPVSGTGSIQIVGKDASGNDTVIDIQIRGDGGNTTTISKLVADSAGNTGVQSKTIQVSPTAVVESVSQSTQAGTIQVNQGSGGAGNTAAIVPAAAGTTAPNTGSNFPSDYARATDVQGVSGSVDSLKAALTDPTAADDPGIPVDGDMPTFGTTFDSLNTWSMPGHVSTCPQPSMDLSMILGAGSVYTMTAHCGLVQDNFATLRAAMLVVWSISALFIVLRA